LVTGPAQLRTLHAVNPAAAAAGLRPGMRLVAAHALLPDFAMVEYDPQAEARWQRFLAAWAYRHSSLVSAQWPGCLVLEVRGSFRLLGPWPRIERRLREELQALGFVHRIALAPTPRAAHVLARLRDRLALMPRGAMVAPLDPGPGRRAPARRPGADAPRRDGGHARPGAGAPRAPARRLRRTPAAHGRARPRRPARAAARRAAPAFRPGIARPPRPPLRRGRRSARLLP